MKSFQVVIVTILLMALLMTSDARKEKCKKQLKIANQQLSQLKTELQEADELNKKLQDETAELKTELQEADELNKKLQNETAECETERQKVEELNNELQNEIAELKTELQEADELNNELQNETAVLKKELEELKELQECLSPLGLASGKLPDSALAASSEWDENHGANNGRLYHKSGGGRTGAWSSKENIKGQWLEVDLGETTKVTMVATQGRYDYDQWVKSYKVSYSKYGGHFVSQNKVYDANSDRNSVIVNMLIQPIEARFIRIYPESWHSHMSMRMELYGCEIQSDCMTPLGMENLQIPDSSITASSEWDANHGPTNARINHVAGGGRAGAWSAKTNDKGQWIQVNLDKMKEITKIGLQGRQDYSQWVTKYKVSYSKDGQNFTLQNQEYIGSKDRNTVFISDLIQPIRAQYVRILPQEWYGHISLRMELYGCDSE